MSLNFAGIRKGMDVYGAGGTKIGSVHDIFPTDNTTGGSNEGVTWQAGNEGATGQSGSGTGPGNFGTTGTESQGGLGTGQIDEVVVEEVLITPVEGSATGGETGTGGMNQGMGTLSGGTGTAGSGTPGGGLSGNQFGTGMGTANGYLEVDHGGLLGIGATHLYIPFSAVQDIVPDDRVTLNVSAQQAEDMFKQKPAFLQTS